LNQNSFLKQGKKRESSIIPFGTYTVLEGKEESKLNYSFWNITSFGRYKKRELAQSFCLKHAQFWKLQKAARSIILWNMDSSGRQRQEQAQSIYSGTRLNRPRFNWHLATTDMHFSVPRSVFLL